MARSRSPTIDGKRARIMYVSMYVCKYLCMVFSDYERGRRPSEFKMIPYDSPMNSTLPRHKIIGMRFLTNPWCVILDPLGLTWVALAPGDVHVNWKNIFENIVFRRASQMKRS